MKSKRRRELGKKRLAELHELCSQAGYRVQVFTPIHVRIMGVNQVDYWPTTGRGWLTHTSHAAQVMTPSEAVEMAGARLPELPAEAADHMRSLRLQ
jgi:hypothetical protein